MTESTPSCPGRMRGDPIAALGYTSVEMSVLAITRHYFASFAAPERQGWIAAIAAALSSFGDDRGPDVAVAVLSVIQSMRRTRRSVFCFNAADCVGCSRFVTGHERLLMSTMRAVLRGRTEAAQAYATLLCEGNDTRPLIATIEVLAEKAIAPECTPNASSARNDAWF